MKLHDSVNSDRYLQWARRWIVSLKEPALISSKTNKISSVIIKKLFISPNYHRNFINKETVETFVVDIDRRLALSRKQAQVSNIAVDNRTYQKVSYAQDQYVNDELTLNSYQKEIDVVAMNVWYTFLILVFCTVILIVYAVRLWKRRAEANRRLVQERQEANVRINQSQKAERQRLGRDLHDGVGVELAVLRMRLSLLADEEADNALLTAAVGDLDRISREVREVAHALMPAELDQGLVSSLRQLVNRLGAVYHQIEINFMVNMLHATAPATEQAVYAMAKELLNNALKHAKATVIDVELYTETNRLYLRVGDNGHGYDPKILTSSNGIGLRNLQATAKELGGEFTVVRKSEYGIVSEVWVEA